MSDRQPCVVVKGAGDIGSAVAHALFRAGLRPVLVEEPTPATARRRMAFADALFEGAAELEGVRAERVDTPAALHRLLASGAAIPLVPSDRAPALLAPLRPVAMVDARMRKRERAPCQLHEALLTIGLGPGFRAGETVHAVVETNWGERLGAVLWEGEAEPYTGQPRAVAGYTRERYLYAPHPGRFRTELTIGAPVMAGQVVAWVDTTPLRAPIAGTLRGLTRDGVPVAAGAKVVDIDPLGDAARAAGIGERPRRIAEGVLRALRESGVLLPQLQG